MDNAQLISAGAILLTVVTIAYGGSFLLRIVNGAATANDLQRTYFRAGHAHAGVLVILGLLIQLYLAQAQIVPLLAHLSNGVLWAAILMPAGFFLSVIGHDPKEPNRLRHLITAGGIVLTIGLISAGVGLIAAGTN
jgi:Ni,Fe-hydrogenase I cytochrome b subunit